MSPPSGAPNPWPAQWLRGVLELAVLAVVDRGETYGYRIAADLEEAGFGVVKGGTLYPLLARLEEDGAVAATWREGESGPGRKWYSATPAGRRRLREQGASWRAFAQVTADLLPDPVPTGGTP
ncbi:PadR family transcriptional regulator [Modestobacter sp. SYSU DS0290]